MNGKNERMDGWMASAQKDFNGCHGVAPQSHLETNKSSSATTHHTSHHMISY